MVVQVQLYLSLTLAQVDSVQGGAAFFLFSLISARGGAVAIDELVLLCVAVSLRES